jgi:hypothetical protein
MRRAFVFRDARRQAQARGGVKAASARSGRARGQSGQERTAPGLKRSQSVLFER